MLRIALVLLALAGCSKKASAPKEEVPLGSQEVAKPDNASVVVTVSVDWEGAFLSDEGLQAMQNFRKEWQSVPLTHFICPAYFTQGEDNKVIAAKIREQIHEGDEVGLHLHSWFSLARAANVSPKEEPSFYGADTQLDPIENGDRGYEVALSAYGPEDLAKLISTSSKLLEDNGLGRPKSFRSGGYIGTPEVLAAVRAAEFEVDSSATWPQWFDASRQSRDQDDETTPGLSPDQLKAAWPNMEELTQPFGIDTAAGPLIEVPNSGSFAEYVSQDEMRGHLQRAMLASQEQAAPIYVNFGFHQESAHEYIGSISDALFNFEKSYPGVLSYSTVTAVAHEATRTQQ